MRVPDRCLADLRERGYLLFEGFLEADELAAAREALWRHYPRPEVYFADPAAHAWLAADQWAGEVSGPWRSWNLNRLAPPARSSTGVPPSPQSWGSRDRGFNPTVPTRTSRSGAI